MALDGSQRWATTVSLARGIARPVRDLRELGAQVASRLSKPAADVTTLASPVWDYLLNSALARAVSRSIRRRIIVSNLAGLSILIVGWLLVSQHNTWLIDAKRAALETQGRIMAAAIASSVRLRSQPGAATLDSFDPDLLGGQARTGIDIRSDALDALDFAIRPEVVAPMVAKLSEGTETRVRIYGMDGTELIDSKEFVREGGWLSVTQSQSENPYQKPKNFWTRFLKWRLASDLPVYQDIDDISGLSYPEVRQSLGDGQTYSMLLMSASGEQIVAISAPVSRAGQTYGVVLLSTSPGEIDEILGDERLRIITLALLAIGATVAASLLLARTVAGPIRRLSEAAEAVSVDITAGDRLPSFANRDDEVGQLSRSFTKMTAALRTRLEASERFAADVAHELKNPLTAARATADTLHYARTDEQRAMLVEQINAELKRLNRLITDVADAQRLDAELALQQMQPIDLERVLDGVTGVFRDILNHDERHIAVVLDSTCEPGTSIVRGHEGRLGQIMTNLIDNAVSFSPKHSTVSVRLRAVDDTFLITVEDQGPGVDPDQIEKIFKRFYTYRPTAESSRGNNSGLGLSITRDIVTAHGGRVWAENRTEGGARFCVELPSVAIAEKRQRNARPTRA